MKNFALIGAGGYIAPRHIQAIHETGNRLIAATDIHDAVGVLDRWFPETRFFTEIERFDRFLEKQRRLSDDTRAHYVSVCTPNYLHDAHVRLALRLKAHAICEKPLVINPWNLEQLAELEKEQGVRIYNVLQLRLLPALVDLRERLRNEKGRRHEVQLAYITRRGPWYLQSWKGQLEKSGGIATNIGIHFFDMLMWLFGAAERHSLHAFTPELMAGSLELERATVKWFLSIRKEDLPEASQKAGKPAFRSITIDGDELELSDGFTDLHTRVYKDILGGGGFGIDEARPAIELVHRIRTSEITSPRGDAHPLLHRT